MLCLACNRLVYLPDPFVFAAVFSTFMLGVLDRRLPGVIGAFIIGVLALAKWSVLFVALPLLVLADVRAVVTKRSWPLQTLALLAAVVAGFSVAGQPLASLPRYLRNGYEISAFFSVAVNSPRTVLPLGGQLAFVACSGALAAVLFADARAGWVSRLQRGYMWLTPLLLGVGWLWVFLALYHASYVRADGGHFYIGWNALLVSLPITLLVAGSSRGGGDAGLRRREVALAVAACALFVLVAEYPPLWRDPRPTQLSSRLSVLAAAKVRSVGSLLGWADPAKVRRFKRERVAALQAIAVRDLRIGSETVDAYPFDLGPIIAAGLAYQPRPTMQAQVAYSPYLQRLDLEHWRGPNAPVHLLFLLGDIDGRLPTLALGPSVVELLSRYDPVDRANGVLHLRRRGAPRRAVERPLTSTSVSVGGRAVSVPHVEGTLTLARIHLSQTVSGRLLNFVRPPFLMIDVKLANGVVGRYRFVPSMAELGFAVSPELESLFGSFYEAPRAETDLVDGIKRCAPVEEFQIRTVGFPGPYAFRVGTVEFSAVQFQ